MASTSLIVDAKTLTTTAFSALSIAKAIAAAGPIQDLPGNANQVVVMLEEADVLLNKVDDTTDSTDSTNEALIDGVLAALEGTSGPSSSVITDMGTVYTNGPNAATQAKAIAAAGPIMDYPGNVTAVKLKLEDAKVLLGQMKNATDAGDGNLTTINNLLATLS